MLLNIIIPLFFLCARLCDATSCTYDRYTGELASEDLLSYFETTGVKSVCTMDVEECDATERRRLDGSCNNLNHPVRGTFFEPVYRVLPAHYFNDSYPRKAADGSDLELPRVIRNSLLYPEKSSSYEFTQAFSVFSLFAFGDVASIHDLVYFLLNKTDCCTAEGMKSRECSPNIIPEDDPVHRFSGIRCLNLTTPRVYSDFGCTNDPVPSPIAQGTGVFDMSQTYNALGTGDSSIRSYEGGLLKVDVDDHGIIWPPSSPGFCPANLPEETRCFGNYPSGLLQTTLLSIWFIRQHNYFAKQLAAVNPCWDDERLFQEAKEINVAFYVQLFFYEWAPTMMGKNHLVKAGVLSHSNGFRDVYDASTFPITSLEFSYVIRWFHTMQEGTLKMYDIDGTFIKEYPLVNTTFRPGFLGINDNIIYSTQHMFRQSAGKIDHAADPDLLDVGLGYIQQSVDVLTSDLHKSRLFGLAPYIDYVHFCTGHRVKSFDDLSRHIDKGRIQQLKRVYKNVWDIELMAGIWSEKMDSTHMPATLTCILTEYLYKAVRFDRHWYERPNRPYAFKRNQLAEIRKSTLAQMICNVADGVSRVQPQAFRVISPNNPLMDCGDIPSIDLTQWADESCSCETYY